LSGPIAGKTYTDVMVPMGAGSSDEWVAGVASYVRTSFGNNAGLVTPADVARVRAASASRKTPWTVAELEASMPRIIEPQSLKLTASHAPETAANALTLRGWSSPAPQAAGMWFQVELPQPTTIAEIQFDSLVGFGGRGGRGGRGAAPAAGPPAAPPTPIVGSPRGYSVQTSLDGTTWGAPVAQGKGDSARTTVTFAPTRAKYIRITQTETVEDAPAWSINNLRVYEAPK
jgi:F5/8 type C domain